MTVGLGRAYSVTFAAVAATVAQDCFYLKPAADKVCLLEYANLSAGGGTADAGDTQEELLRVEVIRLPATVTAGSGGGTFTPTPLAVNDTAAGATARINDTTVATTSGTATTLIADGWNNRSPWVYFPAPEHRIVVANAQAVVVRLNTAPADSLSISGSLIFREIP